MNDMEMKEGMKCNCTHHSVVPWIVILLGLTFLLQAMGRVSDQFVSYAWPILVIIAGLTKVMNRKMCKCC